MFPFVASLGLLPSEAVLRGGFLKGAVVVDQLKVVENRQFKMLLKGCRWLNMFLTKASVCKRPLASTTVFERMATARNIEYQRVLEAPKQDNDGVGNGGHNEDDFVGALGLDIAAPRAKVATASRRQATRLNKAAMPSAVHIAVERPDGSH